MSRARVSRLFVDEELGNAKSINLNPQSAHYVSHVLRLKNDDQIVLFDGRDGREYLARLEIHKKNKVDAKIEQSVEKSVESNLPTHLLQAIGKPDHIDWICQKATELGVTGICLYNSQRTQTPLKGERLQRKLAHWRSICVSACEQCGRNIIPKLQYSESIQSAIDQFSLVNRLILDFNGEALGQTLAAIGNNSGFSLATGPEGGFNEEEIQLFLENGYQACVIGPRVLRMETAAISALTTIQYQFGDIGERSL